MKNENKTDEMVTHLHQYVPRVVIKTVVNVPTTNDCEEIVSETLHHLLIGGDQLTAERVRGAKMVRQNSTHAIGRLEGFIPVSEDWHAKVCFLQVCYKICDIQQFYVAKMCRLCGSTSIKKETRIQKPVHYRS